MGKGESSATGPGVRVNLLGRFAITVGERSAGPWPRPAAKRLCELVFLSPGRRIGREVACEALFPALAPQAAAHALSKALSMARGVLADLEGPAASMLRADRAHVYISPSTSVEVDLELHEQALRNALRMGPGADRDSALTGALSEQGALLEDEAYAEWSIRRRESLELARQEARLALGRDRSRGAGRSAPSFVIEAWEACLAQEPACEEAASALVRLYSAQGRRSQAAAAYDRCRSALEALGLRASPALEEANMATVATTATPRGGTPEPGTRSPVKSAAW